MALPPGEGQAPPPGRGGGPPAVHWTRSGVSIAGVALTTASAIILLSLFLMSLFGVEGSPYLGILAYLVLPALFVLGLLLIPLGLWLVRRRDRRALARGEPLPGLPVLDLNRPSMRRGLLVFLGATAANVAILGAATYKGVELLDSTAFCGSCHRVMDPEHSAYLRSPHARVLCVDCHIGAGASWFVKSKLSGSWQVISYAFHLYPRPIPVPVANLRPARETCEQCHWPSQLVGDRLKVLTHFGDDEHNGRTATVLLMHVGAGGAPPRAAGPGGIHAHVAEGVRARYRSDPSRQRISEVEWRAPDGRTTTFRAKGDAGAAPGEWHVMDCVDCHNRPTHVFPPPEAEIDAAMEAGRLDATLPFLHKEALAVLKAPYPSHQEARDAIRTQLADYYAAHHPQVAREKAQAIEAAAAALGRIYAEDVWPSMNITWGTYPSFTGHDQAPGCFRCHDEEHQAEGGRTISQDCSLCHNLLAQDEAKPAILQQLAK